MSMKFWSGKPGAVATTVAITPTGAIAATTVQTALAELDSEKLAIADIDDTPVNGETAAPISSNWAYDHAALVTAHGISSFGSTLVDDANAVAALATLGIQQDILLFQYLAYEAM